MNTYSNCNFLHLLGKSWEIIALLPPMHQETWPFFYQYSHTTSNKGKTFPAWSSEHYDPVTVSRWVTNNFSLDESPRDLRPSLAIFERKLRLQLPHLVGGLNPSEKYYSSQIGSSLQPWVKLKNLENHRQVMF